MSELLCEDRSDKLCLAATPWAEIVERYRLAWGLWENDRKSEARQRMAECYMRLLPHPVFHRGCELIRDYRRALRVVLDSQWADMCVSAFSAGGHLSAVHRLDRFIAAVEPLRDLDKKQRAAVYAIRGFLSPGQERKWLRKAIDLSPGEGEWRHMLAFCLQSNREHPSRPSKEEMSLLREAYHLRKHPDTILRLAGSLLECGPSHHAECEALVEEALSLFPDHPRALTHACNMLSALKGTEPATVCRIRCLYRRAQEVVGKRAFIELRLGELCLKLGEDTQAERHFHNAISINPSTFDEYAASHGFSF